MTVELIRPNSREHWLELRKQDISSTESAALFGLSPYRTRFELWLEKHGEVESDFTDTARTTWGDRLEPAIAYGIAQDRGWQIVPLKIYMRDTELRMGSSFDFEVIDPARPDKGILEVKNVDRLIHRNNWSDTEAPGHIEIQLQHQLEIARHHGYTWGAIGALVGGNEPVLLMRPYYPDVGAGIRAKIAEFWNGLKPAPIYPEDAGMVIRLNQLAEPGKFVKLTDEVSDELAREYAAAGALARAADERKEVAKAKLLELIGDAEKAHTRSGIKISATLIAPRHVAYEQKGYRDFRITVPKPKQQEN